MLIADKPSCQRAARSAWLQSVASKDVPGLLDIAWQYPGNTSCAACAAAACLDAPGDAGTAMKYGVKDCSMEFTASKRAMCSIAKLREGWMVGGCAPGIRRICRSV